MKGTILAGVILIVVGVLILGYQGITYTQQKKVIDLGPIQATTKTEKHIPLPPILGIAAVAGGALLLFMGRKSA
jgi:drug/metabolite transporter (DMT)-like permease